MNKKIKTITCHNVYNYGATLQEFALLRYIEKLGHDAQTINYRPDYLSNHFNLWSISNPKWKKNIILKIIYLTIKIPFRIYYLKRKKAFDDFTKKYINETKKVYYSNKNLKNDLPKADIYICGSDQIWNTLYKNGKDPAFYLDFVPDNFKKASYAASFAVETIEEQFKPKLFEYINKLDYVSVREITGKKILNNIGIKNVDVVLDPVFLLDKNEWSLIANKHNFNEKYILIYDADNNKAIKKLAKKMAKEKNLKIYSLNWNLNYADKYFYLKGPDVFLNLIKNASYIITNSFHAVAFSIIFEKKFVVFNRSEKINTRMKDLLGLLNLEYLLIPFNGKNNYEFNINYSSVDIKLKNFIYFSKKFINRIINDK